MSSLLRLERKQKSVFKYILNSHISVSFLFIWNWNDNYVHTLLQFPRKPYPIPDQNGQSVSVFRPKRPKNSTLWGGTDLYGLNKGVPPGVLPDSIHITKRFLWWSLFSRSMKTAHISLLCMKRDRYCRVLTATKANKTERFIRSSALLDTKSTHSLYARSHCSVPVCPARTTTVRYALLLIQPLYTTGKTWPDHRIPIEEADCLGSSWFKGS